jgi:hypothetical protein
MCCGQISNTETRSRNEILSVDTNALVDHNYSSKLEISTVQ